MKTYKPNVENMTEYLKNNTYQNSDGPTWYNIPSGMCSVRILPPWDPTGRIALPVYSHRIEFQGSKMKFKKYSWTCVDRTFGKPCKICENLANLKAAGVDTSEYDPNSRTFYCNVIVMYDPIYQADLQKGKTPDQCAGTAPGTMAIMKLPKTIYDWVISQITNPMVGDITSVENGIDIYITKEGSGLGTSYTATLSPNGRTCIPQEYLDKIEEPYNLDEIFSTGFDDEIINELSDTLKKSAGQFSYGVPNAVGQMSGIPQQMPGFMAPPQMMAQPQQVPNTQPPVIPGFMAPPVNQVPQQGIPQMTPQPVAPQASVPATPGMPECFGKYDASSVKCVTCPNEIPCSQKTGK